MDRIVDHVLAFEGDGKIKDFTSNFSEYRESRKSGTINQKVEEANKSKEQQKQEPETINQQTTIKKRLSFKEQRELETIEKEMPELEEQRTRIMESLNNETEYEKIAVLSKSLESTTEKLEEMEMRANRIANVKNL